MNEEAKGKHRLLSLIISFDFVLLLQATVAFHLNYGQGDHISQFATRIQVYARGPEIFI